MIECLQPGSIDSLREGGDSRRVREVSRGDRTARALHPALSYTPAFWQNQAMTCPDRRDPRLTRLMPTRASFAKFAKSPAVDAARARRRIFAGAPSHRLLRRAA